MKLGRPALAGLLVLFVGLVVIPASPAAALNAGDRVALGCVSVLGGGHDVTGACSPAQVIDSGSVTYTFQVRSQHSDGGKEKIQNLEIYKTSGTNGSSVCLAGQVGGGGMSYLLVATSGSTVTASGFDYLVKQFHKYEANALQYPGQTFTYFASPYAYVAGSITTPAGCAAEDPGPPVTPVATPAQLCSREYGNAGGVLTVGVVTKVLNPQTGLADVITITVPWTAAVSGAGPHSFDVPDLGTKPPGGWRAQCKVVRQVPANTGEAAYAGTSPDLSKTVEVSDGLDPGLFGAAALTLGYIANGAAPWLTMAPGTTTAATAAATAAGVGLATTGFVVSAGVALTTALVVADREGYVDLDVLKCGLIDRIRGFGINCPKPQELESAFTRNQTRLDDPAGNPLTREQIQNGSQWKTATSVAEVLINPVNPYDPNDSPEEQERKRQENETQQGGKTIVQTSPHPSPTAQDTATAEEIWGEPSPERTDPEGERDDCELGLLGVLNPFNMFRTIKCALKAAFVPSSSVWSGVRTDVANTFPLNVVAGIITAGNTLRAAAQAGLANECWSIDYGDLVPNLPALGADLSQADRDSMVARLPTPASTNCAGAFGGSGVRTSTDNSMGDLGGFRQPVRNLATLALYVVFAFRVIRAFAPSEKPAALEPV